MYHIIKEAYAYACGFCGKKKNVMDINMHKYFSDTDKLKYPQSTFVIKSYFNNLKL